MARLACLLLTVLVLAPACDNDAPGAFLQAGGTAPTSGEPGEGEPDEDVDPRSLIECEIAVPCEFPFAGLTFDVDAGAAGFSASDRCIFNALMSGEPGLIETVAEFSDATARLDYAIVGPGVALRQASGESDGGGRWQKGVHSCRLQPPGFFADCLKAPSAACFDPEAWVVGCDPLDNLVCPG